MTGSSASGPAFLTSGGAEGWYQLHLPGRGTVAVEFSALAHVLPARHLLVFIPSDGQHPAAAGPRAASATPGGRR